MTGFFGYGQVDPISAWKKGEDQLQEFMTLQSPLLLSRLLLSGLGTEVSVEYQNRIPQKGSLLVVSNHRSYMDAPLLMTALNQSIRFACHHYMGQVPVLRDIVQALGCFPLEERQQRQHDFFAQASRLLQQGENVGIFPEGGQPMVQLTQPDQMTRFHRGFAHLALRTSLPDLMVLPVAIAARTETSYPAFPVHLLGLFDPSEALFEHGGWHPVVTYHQVKILIGRPQPISMVDRQQYQGKQARKLATELTQYCHTEIDQLLKQGFA
ncbi:MAG TPA: lysophospholipid acyltransferase family protein [Stenomitos sp.]